ncbi:MAG: hypothetical protein Q7T76_04960, partial [Ferruginibacter sp.]|nr:hypothetical protein [Ferruginibacter sp.]
MTTDIKNNLNNPAQLERMYRDNKSSFKRAFNNIFPEISETPTAQFWNARINFEDDQISWGTTKELTIVLVIAFIGGLIAKIPSFAGIDPEYFYQRNIGFIVFPLLVAYFAWKHQVSRKTMLIAGTAVLVSAVYINLLPNDPKSDTLLLACIHLPLFLWAVLGFTFLGKNISNNQRRLDYLRYNADLVVMTTIILIAGALLTVVTFGLFKLIDIKIEQFYVDYIATWGLAAAPIIGTYLVQVNPQLVNKVSPVIAKVFTPLVLVTLVTYLIALVFSGKSLFNDREFLLIFNILLIGVMAIIFFSIAETSKNKTNKLGTFLLLALSIVTVIVNGIALSAIVFRISEWGFSPNRLAVLGSNLLILVNLGIVAYRLFRTINDHNEIEKVEESIASFLPVYAAWT